MGCMINEYMLRNRGGVRYKWQETPVNWYGTEYANIYAALYEERDKKEEKLTIPLCVLQDLLQFSNLQWLDVLNVPSNSSRHLMTQLDPAFRKYEKTRSHKDAPFFIPEDLFDLEYEHEDEDDIPHSLRGKNSDYSVDILDFEMWADNNQEMLPENRYKPIASPGAQHDELTELRARIEKLQTDLAERDKTIDKMKNAAQEGTQGAKMLIRSFWQYVRNCEKSGKSDPEIAAELKRDVFSWPAIGMLLHTGDLTQEAVEKAYQRMKQANPDLFPK